MCQQPPGAAGFAGKQNSRPRDNIALGQGSVKPLGLSRQSVAGSGIIFPARKPLVAVAKLWGKALLKVERPGGGGCQEHGRAIPRDKLMAKSRASPKEWLHVPLSRWQSWSHRAKQDLWNQHGSHRSPRSLMDIKEQQGLVHPLLGFSLALA